ncbi:MAG TPA: ribosome maturation factor RimM [Myxococcota bacterium]|nr:ribosome maturation factor RimM [Myxococcota bacterium]
MAPTAGSTSSTDGGLAPAERVALGRVIGAHGLRGQLRVRCFGDGPENLMRLDVAYLGADPRDSDARRVEVARVAAGRGGEVRLELAGIADRESADRLRGQLLLADASRLRALPRGEYYSFQLIGCRVEGVDGERIGTLREVWATGAIDVLVVEGERGEQHLIPAAESQLLAVDLEARRIAIEILPGLLDPA